MIPDPKVPNPKAEDVSRRTVAKKVAYIAPAVLAAIAAAERPALAQSGGGQAPQ